MIENNIPYIIRGINILGKFIPHRKESFNPDELLEKAQKKTGLTDFGSMTFQDGLQMLCQSVNQEANLNTIGRLSIHNNLLGALIGRLKVQHWIKEHPEVLNEKIQSPMMVLGLPRSGTTILSFLLGLDPENRPLLEWEKRNPVPPPEITTRYEDPRIVQCAKNFEKIDRLFPVIKTLHPQGATLPAECFNAYFSELKNVTLYISVNVTSYLEWVLQSDLSSVYSHHKLLLQLLQSRVPTQRWLLKDPQHLYGIKYLKQTYPSAQIVIIHRNLHKVIPSLISITTVIRRMHSDKVDPKQIAAQWLSILSSHLAKPIPDEDRIGNREFYHLRYDDLMENPTEAIRNIYAHFGQKLSNLHETNIQAWLKFNPQNKHGRHRYSLEEFGISAKQIDELAELYRERYDIPFEYKLSA